ncbi:NAD(P)H-dependent flavin oxidoreductase [Oceanobacillus saliphilus]|uniref:NAD(P)H-dependent flavin oxidoreductase n=1 Tax=Oceanobacillus saliphilus TaxID=2925834 RepID=UPI00201E5F66|nr:nitronate monooxygenase [Oceanobacillus saliphilus]
MNKLLEKLKIEIPIIQAGMAGGITSPELVAAVSNAGALGTIGAGYMSPTSLKKSIHTVKELTSKPFAVNLFAVNLEVFSTDINEMQKLLNTYRKELGIEMGKKQVKVKDYLQEKIYLIIKEKVPIVSTAFGVLSSILIDRLKKNNITLIGMATNLEEALLLQDAGYDLIVAQGFEAGGHRGTFNTVKYPRGCEISLHVLVQSLIKNISLPIIAAGGIYAREQIAGLLKQGASGVQLGTRFLVAEEAGTNDSYRRAILKADYGDTVITNAFSGRPARALRNEFIDEMEESGIPILPFPIQNELTKDIRAAGSDFAISEVQSLWAGQGAGGITKEETAREIINSLHQENAAKKVDV